LRLAREDPYLASVPGVGNCLLRSINPCPHALQRRPAVLGRKGREPGRAARPARPGRVHVALLAPPAHLAGRGCAQSARTGGDGVPRGPGSMRSNLEQLTKMSLEELEGISHLTGWSSDLTTRSRSSSSTSSGAPSLSVLAWPTPDSTGTCGARWSRAGRTPSSASSRRSRLGLVAVNESACIVDRNSGAANCA